MRIAAALAAFALIASPQSPATSPGTIWVAANVIQKNGQLAPSLTAADFGLTDNGAPQSIVGFRDDPIPYALAIMVDVSSSMEANYGLVRRAVSALTSHFAPGDRAVVGSFDALPWISPRFSGRPEAVQQGLTAAFGTSSRGSTLDLCDGDWIDKTKTTRDFKGTGINTSMGAGSLFMRRQSMHSGSAIWDGAACGINAVASDGETPRRIVLLITDAVDNASSTKPAGVVTRANQLGVMVYGVAVMGGYGMAGADLRGVAEATGGGYVYLTGEDKVDAAFSAIGEELRHQYILGFVPPNGTSGNHTIAVTSRLPDATVRFRRVSMEMPVGSPLVAGEVVRQGAAARSPLPSAMTGGSSGMTNAKSPAANLPAPKRTAFWDVLDGFTQPDWPVGKAKRMTLDELRTLTSTLRKDGEDWIRAAGPEQLAQRRLTAASFVLDELYSQNDPFLWMDKQPAPDLIEWAANQLQANAPSPQERLWYFGALALCERGGAFDNLERVAYRAWRRFPDEGRFLLARGVAQDLRTWPEERDLRAFIPSPDIASALIARYEEAAVVPAVRDEALLRLAFFEVRRGRALAALQRLDGIHKDPHDEVLAFWVALVGGRALELAGQFDPAIERYTAALDIAPSATSARAALVTALAKAGRPADAAKIANDFLLNPAADRDPWTMYVLPDMRFWTELSTELRKAVVR